MGERDKKGGKSRKAIRKRNWRQILIYLFISK